VVAGLIGLVALVGIGIIFWVLAPYLWSDEDDAVPAAATVALPDVVGMSQDEAEENLRDAGFKAETKTQESTEKDKGMVMEQSPSAGAESEEDSTVAITVGEGRPTPAPGYVLVESDSGNLSMEVPSGWSEHSTGADGTFEGADVDAGEGVGPAITASTDIETFESTGEVPGAYILASRGLAREYDEDQLATSGFNERPNCDVVAREDVDRRPYSGRLVTWNCSTNGSTSYTLAAAPEGRECVVMLQITAYSEADRESAKHILDTFEVDCGRIV
jgi:serine/threonine-protein kinase